jgi:5'-nucleotidase/UDP-sugar diphosphatase
MTVSEGKVSNVFIGDEQLRMDETYRFTIPSFNAAGGDGYPVLTGHPGHVNTGFVDAEVLKEYLESNSPIDVNQYAPTGQMVYK